MPSIFYFRNPDVWAEANVTVQRMFARVICAYEPAEAASHFAPFRCYLALAMWRIAEAFPQKR